MNINSIRKSLGFKIFVIIAMFALLAYFVWHTTQSQSESLQVGSDSLSQGIVDRWGAGVPTDFTWTQADDLNADAQGYLFAQLVYSKDISDVLAKWQPADDTTAKLFNTIVDEHLNLGGIIQAHTDMITAQRPTLDQNWITFTLTSEDIPDACLVLVYHKESQTMFLAERQP